MASLILRLIKGSPLTNAEVDGNFTALNNELATKITASSADTLTNKVLDDISNEIGANHIHFKVKATENLVAGDVVKVTGYNSGENAYEVAKMTAATDVAIGIIDGTIAIGEFGAVVNTGLLEGFDTSAFTVGQILYPNGTGGLTATQPSSGAYQAIAFVLRSHAVNGAALVEASEPTVVRTSSNTGNTVVLRDASGNFSAGTITAALSGNATTATSAGKWTTARTLSFTGDATGSGSVDGSANVATSLTLANSGVTAGVYGSSTNIPQITVDAKGRLTTVSNVAVSIPSGALTFTGDVTGTGSTGSSTSLTLAASGVTAGTYTKVTVDAKGRVTTGASLASGDVTSALGYTPLSNATSYLPLAGGTLTGVLASNKPINLANATYGTQAVLVGNWSGAGWWGLGSESGHIIKLDQVAYADTAAPTWVGAGDITLKLGTKTVLDSSNYSSYALPLSGGTLSGNLSGTTIKATSGLYHGSLGYWKSRDNNAGGNFVVEYSTSATLSDANIVWQLDTAGNAYKGNGTGTPYLHAGNYNSYAPTLTGTGASGTWGISITGSAGQLGGRTSSQFSGVDSAVKTFFISNLQASGTQARTFEIARLAIDYNDWNGGSGPFEIELYEKYYGPGLKKKYVVFWGYGNSYGIQLVEYAGSGDNNFRARIGTPVLVSGDHYYLPVYVDVRYYYACDVRITTNRVTTSSNPPPVGQTYINTAPGAVNISDFSADSVPSLSASGNAALGSNTIIHSGNYNNYVLPLSGGTLTGLLASGRNDVERVFESRNTSAGSPAQFFIEHSYGNVNIGNLRGNLNVSSGALQQGGNQVLHAGNYTSYVTPAQYLGTAATKAIAYNSNSISENITIANGQNAYSCGPITINNGYTITVQDGGVWTVI